RLLALCSPSTQVMASTTLLLPHPLGPTIAVTPVSNASSDRSGKLLKPAISRRFRRISRYTRPRKRLGSLQTVRFSGNDDWTNDRLGPASQHPRRGWPLG